MNFVKKFKTAFCIAAESLLYAKITIPGNRLLSFLEGKIPESHYTTYKYLARRWVKNWGDPFCSQITQAIVQELVLARRQVSAHPANKDLCHLRATFNYGLKKKMFLQIRLPGLIFSQFRKQSDPYHLRKTLIK